MATEIKCSVTNCIYWDNMVCKAEKIEVDTQNGSQEAEDSRETICKTFKSKNR